MARANIKGSEYPIMKIFSDDFVFSIPHYQRPYAWGTEQAEELLEDLLASIPGDGILISDADPYFLGSIVLIKKDSEPASEVVDGQQRLATLTILLSALRHLVPPADKADLTGYLYEKGNRISGTPNRYRLTLQERDAAFFRNYIQEETGLDKLLGLDGATLSDSKHHILENARLFIERLRALPDRRRLCLAQFIIQQCLLIVVSTPDMDSAYRIFSVLNDRGLDLSPTDILKAEVIGAIPAEEQEAYAHKWEQMEDEIGRANYEALFSYIRTIFRKVKTRRTLLKEFRDYVKPSENPKQFVDSVLCPFAQAFLTITDTDYQSVEVAKEINTKLSWLNRIDNSDWLPPAILYLQRRANEPNLLLQFFTDLERLAAMMMVTRANVNERIDRYAQVLNAIEGNADLFADTSPLQLNRDERRQVVTQLDGDLYLSQARLYVLLRLDAALSDGSARYDYAVISVEHVLPQSPDLDSQWRKWFSVDSDRERYVHRLGNLVLLSRRKNSQAQNYDFDDKKTKYFSPAAGGIAPFVLTTQVLKESVWTPEVIERRQQTNIDKLKGVWRL